MYTSCNNKDNLEMRADRSLKLKRKGNKSSHKQPLFARGEARAPKKGHSIEMKVTTRLSEGRESI